MKKNNFSNKESMYHLAYALKVHDEMAESHAANSNLKPEDYDVDTQLKEKIKSSISDNEPLCHIYEDGTGFSIINPDGVLQFAIDLFNQKYDNFIVASEYVSIDAFFTLCEMVLQQPLSITDKNCINVAFELTKFICKSMHLHSDYKESFNAFIEEQATKSNPVDIFTIGISLSIQLIYGNHKKIISDFQSLYDSINEKITLDSAESNLWERHLINLTELSK